MPKEEPEVRGPQDPEKALSVAYLRLTGSTQTESAEAVGVHRDTVWRWEQAEWWPEIVADASRRWLAGLEAKARTVLHNGMDPAIALKILERRLPELAPAPNNLNLHTPDLATAVEIILRDPTEDDDG